MYLCRKYYTMAGRKKLPDNLKRIALTIYPQQGEITILGEQLAKEVAIKAIEQKVKEQANNSPLQRA